MKNIYDILEYIEDENDRKCYHTDLSKYFFTQEWSEGEFYIAISELLKTEEMFQKEDNGGVYYVVPINFGSKSNRDELR